MARIAGIDLPKEKPGFIALTYIFGIGRTTAKDILSAASVDPNIKVKDWTDGHVTNLRQVINDDYKVEGALRAEVQMSIKRLQDINSFRGVRHRKGLPVRGQKTQKNARTRKGKRKTVAGKKKAPRK